MKTIRKLTVVLTAILIIALAAVTASAADSHVTSVDINKSSVSMKAGTKTGLRISYSYQGEKPDTDDIHWQSSDTSVATVSNGTIIARKEGTATVTVEFEGETDDCTVNVIAQKPVIVNTAQAYKQLNSYRSQYNKHVKSSSQKIGSLRRDKKLEKIALIRAKEMAETGKFSHTRPNGQRGITLIKGNKAKGENIAKGQKTCEQVSAAWYESPGHRANMLRKNFKKVGIAGYTCNGTTYWAQIYSS